jgi:hypothetical protein
MKLSKLVVCLGTVALAVATAANRYNFVLNNPTVIGGQTVPSGDYRVEVNGDKAMVRGGKMAVEAQVKVEQNDTKYNDTMVRYTKQGDKNVLSEIMVGGTKNKLVFANSPELTAVR